jgi:hypothetical protein
LQILFRRQVVRYKRNFYGHAWPIDEKASKAPAGWPGWPDHKKFALVLTHDVDTAIGQKQSPKLIKIEESRGFRSSFNFVPERYKVYAELRNYLTENGFEVAVHGLNHDGKLFLSKKIFMERAKRINEYLSTWGSVGFHSPSMHRNLDWIHALNIEYDQSTFDTDPFEPQPDGVGTIFPFWVHGESHNSRYLENPYTLPQDHCLFVIMKERNIDIWKKKLDWIAENGGLALLNSHPDYMNFDEKSCGIETYPASYYEEFLDYVKDKYKGEYWHALPKDVARFWSENMLNSISSK